MSAGRPPLTVIVPTFNEESTLRDCLDSVRFADEILVVDSYSSDATVAIARELGARVLQHEYVYSAKQKNWSIPQATHEWVLLVDSDERVTPELRDEILALLASGPRHDGYWILRANHFLGRRIRRCGWGTDKVIRLFRRDVARYQDREVHAEIDLPGPLPVLRHPLEHRLGVRDEDLGLRGQPHAPAQRFQKLDADLRLQLRELLGDRGRAVGQRPGDRREGASVLQLAQQSQPVEIEHGPPPSSVRISDHNR